MSKLSSDINIYWTARMKSTGNFFCLPYSIKLVAMETGVYLKFATVLFAYSTSPTRVAFGKGEKNKPL